MKFKVKYSVSLEENIFVVKRNVLDYIWKLSYLEKIEVTYSQTEIICDGLTVEI